jgi:hypothetical protein
VWNLITSEYTPVNVVDDLFSLPSPVAVVSLLYKSPKLRLLPLIALAILAQSLVFVSILAPSALLVDWDSLDGSLQENRTMSVPKLDFKTLPMQTNNIWWSDIAKHYMVNDPFESWNVPKECVGSCAFEITYDAPGISCRQTSEHETPLKPFDLQLYKSGNPWSFYLSDWVSRVTWGTNDSPLNFSFVPMITQFSGNDLVSVSQTGPIQGHICEFLDKRYRANFEYFDNVKTGSLTVISDTNDFTQNCSWTSGASLSTDCSHYAGTAANVSLGFMGNFIGTGMWNVNRQELAWQPFPIHNLLKYDVNQEDQTRSLIPLGNLSQLTEDTFGNVVLGILLRLNETELAPVLVDVRDIWLFSPLVLWLVYIPALLLVLVAGLCGLRWARHGNIVREKKFSSFLVATRTKDLDTVCVQHFDVVMSTKLRHDAQTGRFLVLDDEKMDKSTSDAGVCLKFRQL